MSALANAHTQALSSQVGGHAGVLTTDDGSLIIKPALPVELKFYQSLASDPNFEALRPFTPNFLGTLKLEGQVDQSKPSEEGIVLAALETPQKDMSTSIRRPSIVLENLSHPFLKPNILDVKLGTVLYSSDASPEKRERMEKAARDTTSYETGVRLTGFQVYDDVTGLAVNTPKAYGKSIKVADLPDGFAKFFPVGVPASDRNPTSTSGLPKTTLLPILRALRQDIADIREALAKLHMRMVGGSLLIVYEADWARAEEGLKALELDNSEDEDDDDEDDDETSAKRPGPPYVVKLIDFAHTYFTPGEGPDEGVLLGVDTVLKLLDGRIEQINKD